MIETPNEQETMNEGSAGGEEQGRRPHFLLKNAALMIISFFMAVLFWYMCTSQDQKIVSKKFSDIPIVCINENQLQSGGMTVNIDKGMTVNAILKGCNSAMNSIEQDKIVAVVDLSGISQVGENRVVPVISGLPDGVSVSNVGAINITIENLVDKILHIDVEISGRPADGYTVDKSKISYIDTVMVSCGESYSKYVAGAKVVLDVSDRKEDYIVNLNIILVDQIGNEIDSFGVKFDYYSVELSVRVDSN